MANGGGPHGHGSEKPKKPPAKKSRPVTDKPASPTVGKAKTSK